MSIEWSEASSSVIHIAEEYIKKYHPHLMDANIAFIFRSEAGRQQGKSVLAKAGRFPEKLKPLVDTEYDFLIWVSEEDWNRMDYDTRCALIDHELSHCGGDIDFGWSMIPHDVEEFSHIIERHGLWNQDLKRIINATEKHKQLRFNIDINGKENHGKVSSIEVKTFSNVLE